MHKLSLILSVKALAVLFWAKEAFAADSSEYIGSGSKAPEYNLGDHAGEHDLADAAAHANEGHHESAGLPQMDPTWFPSQIFWLALTFTCLYIIFSRKILPEISSTLETRREQIQGDLDHARELKEEAEKVHAAYEEILDEARKKSADIFAETEENIKNKANKQLDDFREKTSKKTSETEAMIEAAKNDAMSDMHSIAAEIASVAAEKIVGISTDIDQAKSLVKNIDRKAA